MKNEKVVFRYFTIADWEQEQEYLRYQHQCGFRFTKVGFIGLYHFERCEPEDVVYQLDYNPGGIAHKDEYIHMFRDFGWEYLQDFAGYSYFRKPVSQMRGNEEIFCDNASRMDMVKQVLKKRLPPLFIAFFLMVLTNVYLQDKIAASAGEFVRGIFIGLLIVYMYVFVWLGYKYVSYWKTLQK